MRIESVTRRATNYSVGFSLLALSYPQVRESHVEISLFVGMAISMLICRWFLADESRRIRFGHFGPPE